MGFFGKKKKSKENFDVNKYIKWFPEPKPMRQTQRKPEFEDFKVVKQIGSGSYSKVLEVKLKSSGERFALKVMSKKSILLSKAVDQVKKEVKILSKIRHSHIIRYVSHFEDFHHLFIILELAQGCNLFDELQKAGRFPELKAARLAFRLLCATAYLHSFQPALMHRDIKPENLIVTGGGAGEEVDLKLIDFGWGTTEKTKGRRTFCGTRDYMAPEIAEGAAHYKGVDAWSIGVVFYEMLVGRPPFYPDLPASCPLEDIEKELIKNIVFMEPNLPNFLTDLVKDLVMKMLCKDPSKRPGCPELLRHGLFKKYGLGVGPRWSVVEDLEMGDFIPTRDHGEGFEGKISQNELEKSIYFNQAGKVGESKNQRDEVKKEITRRVSLSFAGEGATESQLSRKMTMSVDYDQDQRNSYLKKEEPSKSVSRVKRLFNFFSKTPKSSQNLKSQRLTKNKALTNKPVELDLMRPTGQTKGAKTILAPTKFGHTSLKTELTDFRHTGRHPKGRKKPKKQMAFHSRKQSRGDTHLPSNATSYENMTISEFHRYDPASAMAELKKRYKRVKMEKKQLIKAIEIKNQSIKVLETEINELKKFVVMNKETGKGYTSEEVQSLVDMRNEFWKLSKENRDLRDENKELSENLNLTKMKVFTLEDSLKRRRKQGRIQAKIEKYRQKCINEKSESSEEEERNEDTALAVRGSDEKKLSMETKRRFMNSKSKECKQIKIEVSSAQNLLKPRKMRRKSSRSLNLLNPNDIVNQSPKKASLKSPKSLSQKIEVLTNIGLASERWRRGGCEGRQVLAHYRLNMDGIIFTLDTLTKSIFDGFKKDKANPPVTRIRRLQGLNRHHSRAYSCSSRRLKGLNLTQISNLLNELREFFYQYQKKYNDDSPSLETGGQNAKPLGSIDTSFPEVGSQIFLSPESAMQQKQPRRINVYPVIKLDEVIESKFFDSQTSFRGTPSLSSELNSRDNPGVWE